MESLDDVFGCVDHVRYGSRFVFDWGFLVVAADQVDVVREETDASPKEEAVNPPPKCISILLCLNTSVLSKGTSSYSYYSSPERFLFSSLASRFSSLGYSLAIGSSLGGDPGDSGLLLVEKRGRGWLERVLRS